MKNNVKKLLVVLLALLPCFQTSVMIQIQNRFQLKKTQVLILVVVPAHVRVHVIQ